jgi:hypothetical protein
VFRMRSRKLRAGRIFAFDHGIVRNIKDGSFRSVLYDLSNTIDFD